MKLFTRVPRSILAGVVSLFILTTCVSPPENAANHGHHAWTKALRALDPADTATPAYDITAVYLHQDIEHLQIRIDLLDFQSPNELSLDIRIGDESAPKVTPLEIHIPSENDTARISFEPLLDTVIVEVPITEIPSRPRVDVSTPDDRITGLSLDGPVPNVIAPLLLTFYDTFTGRFPAEALRSWDGAHTGPRGERHGLKHLLDAAEGYKVPVVLLNLKGPENLSALDAMGVLLQVEALEDGGLLFSPEGEENDLQFIHLEDPTHLYKPFFSKTTYLPIVSEIETTQPTPDGPSLEVRRALLEIALNADKKDLLVLGGSLHDSTWGSPDMVGVTIAYFASRPYIRVLNAEESSNFPTRANNALILQPEETRDAQSLQVQSALSFAQDWARDPSSGIMTQCQPDFLKCVLVNDTYLAIFEVRSGSLPYLFTRNDTRLHQLIGPSWQVAPGIDIYPAAFTDDKIYTHSLNDNRLVFTSTDGARTKTFKLTDSGLEVRYQTDNSVIGEIPLLVDPDVRFTPGWAGKYIGQRAPGGVAWGLEDGLMVNILVEGVALSRRKGAITMWAFNDSLSLLSTPEDPDFDYPPGHYVPFPMAIAEIEVGDGYFLRLERLP